LTDFFKDRVDQRDDDCCGRRVLRRHSRSIPSRAYSRARGEGESLPRTTECVDIWERELRLPNPGPYDIRRLARRGPAHAFASSTVASLVEPIRIKLRTDRKRAGAVGMVGENFAAVQIGALPFFAGCAARRTHEQRLSSFPDIGIAAGWQNKNGGRLATSAPF